MKKLTVVLFAMALVVGLAHTPSAEAGAIKASTHFVLKVGGKTGKAIGKAGKAVGKFLYKAIF
jgi:hypothetical protein